MEYKKDRHRQYNVSEVAIKRSRSLKTIEIANFFQKLGVVQKQNLLELILLEILLKFIQRFPGRWNVPLMESLAGLQLEKK